MESSDKRVIVRAIYVELDSHHFNRNFQQFISIYRRIMTGFKKGQRMRFYTHLNLIKSNKAKGILSKVFNC